MVRMARPYQQAVGGVLASPAAAPHSPSANQSPGRKVRSPKSPSSPRRKGALSSSGESAEEIQRKIEELQRQIAMMDALKQEKAEPQPSPPVPTDNNFPSEPQGTDEGGQYEEVYEEYEEEVTETEHEADGENNPTSPPQSPKGRYGRGAAVGGAPTSPSNTNKSPSWRDRQKSSVASPTSGGSAAAAAAAAHHDEYRKQMDDLKQKFSFERPGWAAPAEVVQKDAEIDSESIQNPNLKQAQMGGYQRQVKEKDIDLVKGTFVKDTPRAAIGVDRGEFGEAQGGEDRDAPVWAGRPPPRGPVPRPEGPRDHPRQLPDSDCGGDGPAPARAVHAGHVGARRQGGSVRDHPGGSRNLPDRHGGERRNLGQAGAHLPRRERKEGIRQELSKFGRRCIIYR
jgi:hypothetical protein